MKLNQFGRITVSRQQQRQELKTIRFIDDESLKLTPTELWVDLLGRAFPEAHTPAMKQQIIAGLLATPEEAVPEYVTHAAVTPASFYLVALQLLGFEPGTDFDATQPLAKMKTLGLPFHEELQDTAALLECWYDFLVTQTPTGQPFIDVLATRGYFAPFYSLPASQKPVIFNGKAMPVFDPAKMIREVVYVEAPLDTDHDGQRDLLRTEIIRPAETAAGLRVPVVYTASPYNEGTNDQLGEHLTHNVDVPLKRRTPDHAPQPHAHPEDTPVPTARPVRAITKTAAASFTGEFAYTLNEYLLTRGFAVVYSAGIGTRDSDGLRTCGSAAETLAATSVIEWLGGKRTAFTDHAATAAIQAWWSNGNVAMTGKSYLGTLATACATTGVPNLKTIISEAAISNWYDYYRDGGLAIAPGGFPGEDADVLAAECFSRTKQAADFHRIKPQFEAALQNISREMDREGGTYNTFWDARNYLNDLHNVTADIVMVHGLNDWNVKLRNVFNLWNGLKELPVKQKLILHQGQHIYINNFQSLDFSAMMNLWLTHKLYGVNNGAETALPDVLVQDNTQEETWHVVSDWGGTDCSQTTYFPTPEHTLATAPATGQLSYNDHLATADFDHYRANIPGWTTALLTDKPTAMTSNRLVFKTQPLNHDVFLEGQPQVTLPLATTLDHGLVSAMLVDYGAARRFNAIPTVLKRRGIDHGFHLREEDLVEFKLAKKETPFKMITKGHRNLQNRTNLWQTDELVADTTYPVTFALQPMFYRLKAGHQLGLVVYATDMEMTVRENERASYTLDLAGAQLTVQSRPVV